MGTLLEEIAKESDNKTLIFVETKKKCDDIGRRMRRDGWPVGIIHGDKNQQEQDFVLNEFRNGKYPILIATDVASRGLDVEDIRFVINFDYPNSSEDYVHRIGRTGRVTSAGTAYTFFTSENFKQSRDLIEVLTEANQPVNPKLSAMGKSQPHSFKSRGVRGRGASSSRGSSRGGSFNARDSSRANGSDSYNGNGYGNNYSRSSNSYGSSDGFKNSNDGYSSRGSASRGTASRGTASRGLFDNDSPRGARSNNFNSFNGEADYGRKNNMFEERRPFQNPKNGYDDSYYNNDRSDNYFNGGNYPDARGNARRGGMMNDYWSEGASNGPSRGHRDPKPLFSF